MQRSSTFSPFLLALASLIFMYLSAPVVASPEQLLRPFILLWFMLLFLLLPAHLVTKDWNWASILLMIVVLGIFSSRPFASNYSLIILSVFLPLWVIFRLFKLKFDIKRIFLVINILTLSVILFLLFLIYQRSSLIPASYYNRTLGEIRSENFVDLDAGHGTRPDIYFIVLDGYGRADVLKELYSFDNSDFIDYLEQKGFTVPVASRSNYPRTALSVSSTLNLDYIESFAPGLEASNLWWLMSPWIDQNRVRTSLEKIGYSSVSVNSGWGITDNPSTDVYLKSHPVILSDFEGYLLTVTPLKMILPLLDNFASVPTFESHRRIQRNNFNSLTEVSKIPGPKFVFVHIVLPHPPFVFSSDGTPINPKYSFTFNDASDYPGSSLQYRDPYLSQLQFLNNQLESVVDLILRNSQTPPIILLQADHGPGMLTDFVSVANTCLPERLSTFSAYYLPGKKSSIIPHNITAVNLFRIIFNEYFWC